MRRPTTVKLLRMSRDEGGFRMVPVAIGVDFGTTNSVVAIADLYGQVQVRQFERRSGPSRPIVRRCSSSARVDRRTRRWVIYPGLSAPARDGHRRRPQVSAISQNPPVERDVTGRLFARPAFSAQELVGVFLKGILPAGIGDLPVVCGRPVVFAGERPNEALAIERLTPYRSAGVAHVDFAYEPLGAAYWYAPTIQRQETVLVADFGGGTSDFSVMSFDLGGARIQAEALSHAGIGAPATPSIFASSTIWFRLGSARAPVIGRISGFNWD